MLSGGLKLLIQLDRNSINLLASSASSDNASETSLETTSLLEKQVTVRVHAPHVLIASAREKFWVLGVADEMAQQTVASHWRIFGPLQGIASTFKKTLGISFADIALR